MKLFTAVYIALTLLSGCSPTRPKETGGVIQHIDATAFKRRIDTGEGIILDVRTPEEVAGGYILHASMINLYDDDFEEKINLIPKNKEIYVYCKSGGRSAEAAMILQKNGFAKIYNLAHGITEWEEKGFPLVKTRIENDEKIQEISLPDFELLLTSDKPVLIDFHTVWCAPCRKMAPLIDKIEADLDGKAIVKRIDVDKSKDVGTAYMIKGVPVFMLFVHGEVKWKHHGIISEEELKSQIEKYL